MSDAHSVLIVGGNMYIGQLARRALHGRFRVKSIDRQPMIPIAEGEESAVGDIGDSGFLFNQMIGYDVVIDMSKLDLDRWNRAEPSSAATSITNLWEGARRAGVKRVVALVSDCVVGFYRRGATLDHLTPPRPDSPLGLMGTMHEATASLYSYKYGIQSLAIRMGACRPEPLDERMLSTWISPNDFTHLLDTALNADFLFEVVYGVSANTERWWDNSNARRLGYSPRDKSDSFAARLRGRRSSNAIENAFQGGAMAANDFAGDARRIP